MFCFPLLERQVAERDATIAEQKQRIADLEDRLFMRFGMAPRSSVLVDHGKPIPPYRTGRQRVKDMLTPPVNELSAEEAKTIEESLTQ